MSPSFVHGLDTAPLRFETIGQALDASVSKWGSNDALVVPHQDIRWTYTEFKQRVDALAAGLLALGLSPGERIGIAFSSRSVVHSERDGDENTDVQH